MFTLYKISIKTTFILFLFTTGVSCLLAGNPNQEIVPEIPNFNFPEDTINNKATTQKTETTKEDEFNLPTRLIDKAIHFQVNSDISYFRFSHFVKSESKKMFFQAWSKERELDRISTQTDSLRKVYANSANGQKDEISTLILKNEERSISLNQEIPDLYQNARDEENQYWQSASADELASFQEKIRLFRDSVRQIESSQNGQTETIIPDTIIFHNPTQKIPVKTEVPSGIIYKIQVGSFKGKVPDSAVKSIKKLSIIRKVENYKDEKGVTIYTTGNLKNYEEAATMLNQVKQEGIKNATITAYQNKKKITIEEARKLNKEL